MSQLEQMQALLDEAEKALRRDQHSDRVTFWHKGAGYVARQTLFRILVDTPQGKPVACRWL